MIQKQQNPITTSSYGLEASDEKAPEPEAPK